MRGEGPDRGRERDQNDFVIKEEKKKRELPLQTGRKKDIVGYKVPFFARRLLPPQLPFLFFCFSGNKAGRDSFEIYKDFWQAS